MFFEAKARHTKKHGSGIRALLTFMFRAFYLLVFSFVPVFGGTVKYRRISNVFLISFYVTAILTTWIVYRLNY